MPINSPTILVVGGAGFIGSHMVLRLKLAGFAVLVLDNLSKGHEHALLGAPLIKGDIADDKILTQIFSEHDIAAVMHFASYIDVAESLKQPERYYQNNVAGTLTLLQAMLKHQVKTFIFSSSAAVYGEPDYTPIDELHPLSPLNPYGRTKWMVEEIVKDYAHSAGLHYAILRYFNAAGADAKGRLKEYHQPETHLIPLALQVAMGKREYVHIYGCDYPTDDGSCVRDFIHVSDICEAHLLALKSLLKGEDNLICNLGTGQGYSVLQVLAAVTQVTGQSIATKKSARRPGDPAILIADATLAKERLQWQPLRSDLHTLVHDAFQALQKP